MIKKPRKFPPGGTVYVESTERGAQVSGSLYEEKTKYFNKYEKPLQYFISKILTDMDDTVEISQEAFAQAFIHCEDEGISLESDRAGRVLWNIARKKAYSRLKERNRFSGLSGEISIIPDHDKVHVKEIWAAIVQGISEIKNEKVRTVLQMRILEDPPVDHSEIAKEIGRHEKSVYRLFKTGSRELKAYLIKNGIDLDSI